MPIDGPQAPTPSRTSSGGFKTSDGTLYVSKPYRSKTSKKLRAMITFAPRKSHFDTTNESSGANEFRGFFSLFWISMFLFTVSTYVNSIETSGHALNLRFATMFSKDAVNLAISDAVLVGSTFLCVPFARAVSKGWFKYYWTGVIIQHLFQTAILFAAITWAYNRDWPWVQSGFLTLHSLVMIMKSHSYMSINGYLQHVSNQSEDIMKEMKEIVKTQEIGGWEKSLVEARAHKHELDSSTGMSTTDASPVGTPAAIAGTETSYVDATTANALRKRLNVMSTDKSERSSESKNSFEPLHDSIVPHPLIDHPNEHLSALANEYTELRSELCTENVKYPENLTWKNYAVYLLIPSLVYELEYPRTDRIRPLYLFEKTVATFGTFALLYTVTETFILPNTPSPGDQSKSFPRLLLDLALPFMMAYLLLFFIIFECICNAFAELSYFADRRFYDDWWNSTSQDEFSRKWNKPVHTFLLRHVYASSMSSYNLSRQSAMLATFFFSACIHELVMVVVTRKIRMYLFLLQLIQIPLIAVSRIPAIKKNRLMGNIVFWLGLYCGFPLLCVAYVAY